MFRKAGIVGARNANMRMYSLIDSMLGIITTEEEARGVDSERIVDFDIAEVFCWEKGR